MPSGKAIQHDAIAVQAEVGVTALHEQADESVALRREAVVNIPVLDDEQIAAVEQGAGEGFLLMLLIKGELAVGLSGELRIVIVGALGGDEDAGVIGEIPVGIGGLVIKHALL